MQGVVILIPGQGTRSHMLQLRVCMPQLKKKKKKKEMILHTATKKLACVDED